MCDFDVWYDNVGLGFVCLLQEALRSCFESTVLPAFERTCRTMLDHVESSFQHGMSEYTQHAQEQLLSSHSDLASTLKVCPSLP